MVSNERSLLALAFFFPVLSFGQAITATVVGTVTDPSGTSVPGGLHVAIRNVQTNQLRDAITNSLGGYEFLFLPVGSYTLAVNSAGFQRAEVSVFSLSVDQVARVDLKLVIGQPTDKVEVTAAAVGPANRKCHGRDGDR